MLHQLEVMIEPQKVFYSNSFSDYTCVVFQIVISVSILLDQEMLIVDQTTTAGNHVKILLVVYGQSLKIPSGTSNAGQLLMTSVAPPTPLPPRLRHVARRAGLETKGWKFRGPKV